MRNRTRALLLLAVLAAALVVAFTVPLPSPLELRDWAVRLGPTAPLVFFLAHAIITTTPVPRTAFTLAAGLMFGPVWGLALAVGASLVSALLGFAIARRLGGRAIARLGPHRVRALEERLCERELLTVTSTRLVGIPFAPLNYTLGVTSVGWPAYVVGTLVGLVPGTAVVVLLGDAVTGGTSPAMIVILLVTGTLGAIGVIVSARGRRRTPGPDEAPEPDAPG
ncbi:TVP38/TMEM64 family protein [Actinomycetospora sp. TBRC 11914]|uniref:TVP38/TMEM64 family protein n=1 Tax=Actinomycetospora sp. TBRC 11914 TaxID=2729387 RepID=UPI00145D2EDA|nr:TVP38/TMEM64 family protein [Actinomycetospora sp. TBRC 11914]NMO92778.1 TVP38/TMEM64 family protein [Actinomycetospora sp. TBRC 11914]